MTTATLHSDPFTMPRLVLFAHDRGDLPGVKEHHL